MSWTIYPNDYNPYFGDGVTYGDELGRVSPEGNIYGMERRVREVKRYYWWDGLTYVEFDVEDQAASVSDLPTTPRPFGEMWRVPKPASSTDPIPWDYYYWDSTEETWKQIHWFNTVNSLSDLPQPGLQVGAAHIILHRHVKAMWDGYTWRRATSHSSLENDEPGLHLPPGFISSLQPDARVVYYGPQQIDLEPVIGGSGNVWVDSEYVSASAGCSVYNDLAVLDLISGSIVAGHIQPSTEYWIYLANTVSEEFDVDALPPDGDAPATPAWDYRGKLFLSNTDPESGYFGSDEIGRNARVVGIVETDDTAYAEDGPKFIRELDISLISREVSFPETYRDYSDFRLAYIDEQNISMELLDRRYGQIYVAGSLHYLGFGYTLNVDDPWIEWDNGDLIRHTDALPTSATAYAYLAGNVDPYNFNDINEETGRPLQPGEEGYQSSLDMRLRPFLSDQLPDHGVLDEAWPGYCARHLGQVYVDATNSFAPNHWISSINPNEIDRSLIEGTVDCRVTYVSTTEFQLVKASGVTGLIWVRDEIVEISTYFQLLNSDPVKIYNEGNPTSPLSGSTPVSSYPDTTLYVYVANSRSMWGSYAGKHFWCTSAPTDGYLSTNWPGNNARWIATIKPNSSGKFYPDCLLDSIGPPISNNAVPTGTVLDFAGPTCPTGFLVCNGAAISRSTYDALFAAIGTTWGVGDGSTTFNIPDLINRTTIGEGVHSLGELGGEVNVQLALSQIPSHNHGGGGSVQTTEVGITLPVQQAVYPKINDGTPYHLTWAGQYWAHSHWVTFTIPAAGSGYPHNNMQPYGAVLKIIKT